MRAELEIAEGRLNQKPAGYAWPVVDLHHALGALGEVTEAERGFLSAALLAVEAYNTEARASSNVVVSLISVGEEGGSDERSVGSSSA